MDKNQEDDKILDIQIFQMHQRNKLIKMLDLFPGQKVMILENSIYKKLQLIIDPDTLEENGVKNLYYLDSENVHSEIDQFFFLIPPDYDLLKLISRIILNHQRQGDIKKYCILISPQKTQLCYETLEKNGVLSSVEVHSFNFDLIPLDTDLLSLELNDCFKKLYFEKDVSILQLVADSIQKITLLYGNFSKVFVKGVNAKNVLEIILNREKEGRIFEESLQDSSCLESLIIIDRKSDMITPLCTPFTYQAMLDMFFEIEQNTLYADSKLFAEKDQKNKSVNINSQTNALFKQLRGQNIKVANQKLDQLRGEKKLLQSSLKKKEEQHQSDFNIKNLTEELKQMKKLTNDYSNIIENSTLSKFIIDKIDTIQFQQNFKAEIDIILHANSEKVIDHIENLIAFDAPIYSVLRLLCLYSQISNGIIERDFNNLRQEIIKQYGVQHIETLLKLEQMNLLKKQTQKCHWEVIMDGLKLVNDEVDQEIPMDFSYVYLAYAPITSRLVEQTFSIDNWKKITRELELIPGPTLFNDHRVEVGKKKTMIVVYFIGGVTYGEIATLRWMGQRYNKEIIIATTHIINGKKFFDDIVSSDKQNNQSNKSNQEQQQEQLNKEEHQQQQ